MTPRGCSHNSSGQWQQYLLSLQQKILEVLCLHYCRLLQLLLCQLRFPCNPTRNGGGSQCYLRLAKNMSLLGAVGQLGVALAGDSAWGLVGPLPASWATSAFPCPTFQSLEENNTCPCATCTTPSLVTGSPACHICWFASVEALPVPLLSNVQADRMHLYVLSVYMCRHFGPDRTRLTSVDQGFFASSV